MDGRLFKRSRPRSDNDLNKEIIFIVEGVDDAVFIETILIQEGFGEDCISICIAGSKSEIVPFVKSLTKSSQFISGNIRRYAVFCDADEGTTGSNLAREITGISGVTLEVGSIKKCNDGRIVGIFEFANRSGRGNLEELCLLSIAAKPFFAGTSDAFSKLVDPSCAQDAVSKRMFQMVLALNLKPLGAGIGMAIKHDLIDVASPEFAACRMFLLDFVKA